MLRSVLAASAALAAARNYEKCAPASLGPSPSTTGQINNNGANAVQLLVCNSTAPGPTTCDPSNTDAVFPCLMIPANATTYISVDVAGTALIAAYFVSQPFNWHPITTTKPLVISLPDGLKSPVDIPYPSPGAQLCDTSADCPPGLPCTAQGVCTAGTPSPAPVAPSPQPVPTPPAMPAATACNLTGTWEQPHAAVLSLGGSGLGHSGDAFVSINMTGTGTFVWECTSGHALCPYNTSKLSGAGVLSSTDNTWTLTPAGGAPGPVTGVINSTYACSLMTVTSPNHVPWNSQASKPPAAFNLDVTLATFLGQGAGQFVGTGVAVLSAPAGKPALIAVAGNGQPAFAGVQVETVLGATAGSNGTILVLSVDTTAPRGSGGTVTRVVKVGDRVDHLRANSAGAVAVVGSFGVAVLSGLASTAGDAVSVSWSDRLADLEPGSCGVCCSIASSSSNDTCRVDIGEDGTVLVDYSVTDATLGDLWGAYTAQGKRFAQAGAVANGALDSIAVDSARQRLLVGWFYNSNTGKEPMVMPRVHYYQYDPQGVQPIVRLFDNFPWDAHVYRTPGQPCNGDVADGRVMGLRVAGDADSTILFMGRSDGGDSPFQCGMRDSTRITPMAGIDGYTSAYNMAANAITNFLRVDGQTGEAKVAQIQLARVPSNQKGNTLVTTAAQGDSAGNVYLLQNAACCIANMANLTVNGQALAGPGDATVLQILTPSLETRLHWTHFTAPGGSGGGQAVDIDVKGGTVAALLTSSADMVTAGALPGTGPNVGGQPVAYLVVMPTVA